MRPFSEGVDEIRRLVGKGKLTGAVEVNQVYAHYQDSGHGPHGKPASEFNHPQGGRAGYLSGNLTEHRRDFLDILSHFLDERSPLDILMIRVVEELSTMVEVDAPRELWFLRQSAHPTVERDGRPIYDRPPIMPRLPEELLKMLKKSLAQIKSKGGSIGTPPK